MKFITQTALAAALFAPVALAPSANAEGFYGKLSVGQSEADVSGVTLDEDLAYGVALGTAVGFLRVEAGVSRLSGNFAGFVTADALDYRATAYLDFPVGDHAALFAGAGVDYIDGEASVFGSTLDASGEGYHWAVGGAYRFSPGVIGEVQFRQVTAELDSDFGNVDLEANEMTVGLRLAL